MLLNAALSLYRLGMAAAGVATAGVAVVGGWLFLSDVLPKIHDRRMLRSMSKKEKLGFAGSVLQRGWATIVGKEACGLMLKAVVEGGEGEAGRGTVFRVGEEAEKEAESSRGRKRGFSAVVWTEVTRREEFWDSLLPVGMGSGVVGVIRATFMVVSLVVMM